MISVIIPTYNRSEFLNNAIQSVLAQTYKDFELLVIDDCSTDITPKLVGDIDDKRIKYIRNDTNKGVSASRNIGIKNSSGEYIAFLDDDDEWLPQKLEKQMDIFSLGSPNLGCVYTLGLFISATSGKIVKNNPLPHRGRILSDLLYKNFIITSSVLFRRECFKKVGLFDESVGYAEDYDMWIRMSVEYEFDYVDEIMVKHNVHERQNSKGSNSVLSAIKGLELLLDKHSRLLNENKKAYNRRLLRLGVKYCCNGATKKGRELFLKAIYHYPYDIRSYYNLALSLFGADAFIKIKKMGKNNLPIQT